MAELDDPGPDPAIEPLAYPGRPPPWSALVVGARRHRLRQGDQAVVVDDVPPRRGGTAPALDDVLADLGVTGWDGRRAVLAIGSNASPATLHRKFTAAGVSTVVVLVAAGVHGLHVGHSAHVSTPGYLAAAARADPTVDHVVATVVWADDDQVAALDVTEPNYRRRVLPEGVQVSCALGPASPPTSYYASRWGLLGDATGAWPLADQRTTIQRLLTAAPGVRAVTGPGVDGFVARCRADPAVRAAVGAALAAGGLVVDG